MNKIDEVRSSWLPFGYLDAIELCSNRTQALAIITARI
ncbi:hypothetical protein NIES2104_13550 [Leptolyngbya sp. NIES-2104]|nr:hypothetical protein NIES2104_13550 [Leptolyngbya sp. NIES-2104]